MSKYQSHKMEKRTKTLFIAQKPGKQNKMKHCQEKEKVEFSPDYGKTTLKYPLSNPSFPNL